MNIDLLEPATRATWRTGTLAADGHSVVGETTIPWNGSDTDSRGFARRQTVTAEDGKAYDALWTHPKWASRGTIKGFLPWQAVPAGAVFVAKCGFKHGAGGTDGVRFQVWVHYQAGGEKWTRVVDLEKKTTGQLVEVRADLSWLAGQSCQLELRADAGPKANQDWALWIAPRIETREGPQASLWRFRPSQLVITDRDQAESDGDDPALVALYFRTSLGHRGSSKVVTRTRLVELANDKPTGTVVPIVGTDDLAVEDALVSWSTADLAIADGVSLAGMVLAGIELDSAGSDVVRERVATKASRLLTALRTHLEPLTVPAIVAAPASLGAALDRVAADVAGGSGVVVSGGGFDLVGAIEGWLGHDPVGENRVSVFGVDEPAFTALTALLGDSIALDPAATKEPVGSLAPRTFKIRLSGSGSVWTVDVVVERVNGLVKLPTGI